MLIYLEWHDKLVTLKFEVVKERKYLPTMAEHVMQYSVCGFHNISMCSTYLIPIMQYFVLLSWVYIWNDI